MSPVNVYSYVDVLVSKVPNKVRLWQPLSGRSSTQPSIPSASSAPCTMRFGSTAKVLAECKLKYYRISECLARLATDSWVFQARMKG